MAGQDQQRMEQMGMHWLFLAMGTCAAAAGQWLSVWLLARTAAPELVGKYGLASAWLVPLFAFCGLQLRPMLATEIAIPERLAAYRDLRWLGMGAAGGMVLGAAWLARAEDGLVMVLVAAALPRLAEMVSDFSYGLRTRRAEFRAIGLSQLLRSVASFAMFGLVWMQTRDLSAALLASGGVAIFVTFSLDRDAVGAPTTRVLWGGARASIGDAQFAAILRVAFPLAAVMFLNQAVVAAPRLLLGHWLDWESIATLSCLMSLLVLPSLLATSYAAGLSGALARLFELRGVAGIWPLTRTALLRVLVVALPCSALLISYGSEGMVWIFGDAYRVDYLTLSGAALFAICWAMASVLGTAATAARRVAPQVIAFGVALAVCLMLGLLLIPRAGIVGATLSLGGAGLALVVVYLAELHWSMSRQMGTAALLDRGQQPEEGTADA